MTGDNPHSQLDAKALEAAIAAHDRILGLPALQGDKILIRDIISVYLASLSGGTPGKEGVEPVAWRWTWKSATEDDGWAYTETAPTGFDGQRIIEPLYAPLPPAEAAPVGVTESCGCVFRDLNVPCRDPECKICHDLSAAKADTDAIEAVNNG